MASMQTVPSADEILAALGRDPRFPMGSDEFNLIKDYIVLLPEVIGEKRLGQLVTLGEYCQVEADFLSRLLETDFGKDLDDLGLIRQLYGQLSGQLAEIAGNVGAVLAQLGQTEQEAMVSEQIGLNDELRGFYRAGRLSFADMVRLQPGIFIPKSS